MSEIYWITTLGNISNAGIVFFVLSLIILVVSSVGVMICKSDKDESGEELAKKFLKYTISPFVISLLIAVFVPSTKQMYLIYGLGSTLDYIQSSDKAKKLPDKAVEALTRYLDSIEKEKEDK